MRAIRNAIVSCSVITALIISQPAMAAISYDAQPAPTEVQSVTWDHGIALFQSSQPNSQLTKNMDFANLIVNIAGDTHAMKFNIVKK